MKIENIFILKSNVNTFKKIRDSFRDIDLDKETGLSNKEIIFQNFMDNEEKIIHNDKFIFVIKYNYFLTPKIFLNYLGSRYKDEENDLILQKGNSLTKSFLLFILLSIIILDIFFIFLAIFGLFDFNDFKKIVIITGIIGIFSLFLELLFSFFKNNNSKK